MHILPKSFNHAILEQFTKGLKDGGHTFEVNDLHTSEFDSILKTQDLDQFTGGQMSQDGLSEKEKVKEADILVFVYPVIWWGFPTILKGWFDRIISYGWAYTFIPEKGPEGFLKEKKALLINTNLPHEKGYEALGAKDAMKKIIDDLRIKWCGISNIDHVFLYRAARINTETRKKYLEEVSQLGKGFSDK